MDEDRSRISIGVNKWLNKWIVSFCLVAIGISLTVSAISLFELIDNKGPLLGEYRSPRIILSTRPNTEGPAITSQGMLLVRGYRCIREDTVVELSIIYYRADLPIEEKTSNAVVDPLNREVKKNRAGGCFDEDILLSLPEAVTATHQWYIQAVELSRESGDIKIWSTEPFTVVQR